MSEELAIRQVIEGIRDTFSTLDVDAWLSHFNPQHTFVNHGAVFVAQRLDDTKKAFAPTISVLKERGYSGTILDRCNVRVVGPKTAVAATQWRRLGQGGEVLEYLGVTYTLVKGDSGWKVAVVTIHDENVVLVD